MVRSLLFSLLFIGCSSEQDPSPESTNPEPTFPATSSLNSWAEDSHSNDVPANYDQVFDSSSVLELRIHIQPTDYEAMQSDLDSLLSAAGGVGPGGGVPGGGNGGGPPTGAPPQELFDACADLTEGDPCEVQIDGMFLTGFCESGIFPELICSVPPPPGGEGGGGGGGGGEGEGEGGDLIGQDPLYVPVDVIWNGSIWNDVAMRYKGNSSLSFSWTNGIKKLPFRLHFDHFEDENEAITNQRFYGFKKLTFASGFHDDSLIRDALMSDVLTDMGVPAARYRFVNVTVNYGEGDVNYGLYTMLEDPSDAMSDRLFGLDSDPNIYKPDGPGADWTMFDEAGFVKKTNKSEADFSDIQDAVAALQADNTDAEQWRTNLEATFDAPEFVRWLAVNTFVGNWDTYGVIAHNYYLFTDPATKQVIWVPWDHNESFAGENGPMGFSSAASLSLDELDDHWPLIRFLLDDPVYHQLYLNELQLVQEGLLSTGRFEARVLEHHELIDPYIEAQAAPYQTGTYEGFVDSVGQLNGYMAGRHALAQDQGL